MKAKDFVELFYNEKNQLLKQYFNKPHSTQVGSKIDKLDLSPEQMTQMHEIIDTVLTDVMYTILLGLDGEASIGDVQQTYKLYDENGCKLTVTIKKLEKKLAFSSTSAPKWMSFIHFVCIGNGCCHVTVKALNSYN